MNEYLGKFIKERRTLANRTQAQLATKAGVGLRFYTGYRAGKAIAKDG